MTLFTAKIKLRYPQIFKEQLLKISEEEGKTESTLIREGIKMIIDKYLGETSNG